MTRPIALVLAISVLAAPAAATPSRIKDIAMIGGQGRHKLLGYGLVAGLEGTGDSASSLLTTRSIANLLESFGVTLDRGDLAAKNLAAVIVTAELPASVSVGDALDATVSSLADAKSLQGGTLLLTPLRAADGEVYATAQGAITIGGFAVETRGGDKAQKNHPTVGRVPGGASVVKPLSSGLDDIEQLSLSLLQPDFTTAVRIAEAINQAHQRTIATALNNATVQVALPPEARDRMTDFISRLENLPVEPAAAARVVLNERTGTVVIGQHVRIMPVAICHGGLTVEIKAETQVSQPPPLVDQSQTLVAPAEAETAREGRGPGHGAGHTVVANQQDLTASEAAASLIAIPEQASLQDLVTALNALGVKPRDLIAVIQALKEAQALQAEVILF